MAKFIDFVDAGQSESGKTLLWHVVPKDSVGGIGLIHWYGPWRKYCFSPHAKTVYEQQCLRDIADFCEQKTREHKATPTRAELPPRPSSGRGNGRREWNG